MSPISQGTAPGLTCHHIRQHPQSLYQSHNHLLRELLVLLKEKGVITYTHYGSMWLSLFAGVLEFPNRNSRIGFLTLY